MESTALSDLILKSKTNLLSPNCSITLSLAENSIYKPFFTTNKKDNSNCLFAIKKAINSLPQCISRNTQEPLRNIHDIDFRLRHVSSSNSRFTFVNKYKLYISSNRILHHVLVSSNVNKTFRSTYLVMTDTDGNFINKWGLNGELKFKSRYTYIEEYHYVTSFLHTKTKNMYLVHKQCNPEGRIDYEKCWFSLISLSSNGDYNLNFLGGGKVFVGNGVVSTRSYLLEEGGNIALYLTSKNSWPFSSYIHKTLFNKNGKEVSKKSLNLKSLSTDPAPIIKVRGISNNGKELEIVTFESEDENSVISHKKYFLTYDLKLIRTVNCNNSLCN